MKNDVRKNDVDQDHGKGGIYGRSSSVVKICTGTDLLKNGFISGTA